MRALALSAAIAAACDRPSPETAGGAPSPSSSRSWIRGDLDQRFDLVAKHLRGLDVAMAETGYRYGELYWAGRDRNWEYAAYQLEKIETAIANGIERRPKRAASAAMLGPAVAGVRTAIERRDEPGFDGAFATLTRTCNACHAAERVAFIQVVPPRQRVSPVGPHAEPPGPEGSP
jgi:hypothetical protein